jgi:hypothetical protein
MDAVGISDDSLAGVPTVVSVGSLADNWLGVPHEDATTQNTANAAKRRMKPYRNNTLAS